MSLRALLTLAAAAALLALAAAGARAETRRDTLWFTLPDRYADSTGCRAGRYLIPALGDVRLWHIESGRVVQHHAARDTGARDFFVVEHGDEQASYFVEVARADGRSWSCHSNVFTFNGRVGVHPDSGGASGPWLGVPRPNPAGGLVAVPWCLPSAARVRLEVVDVAGRVVARLAEGSHAAGVHVALWDARAAAPGIYLVRLELGGWRAVRRELVLR